LDIDWGSYPFVTSSNTVPANAASGTGVGVNKLQAVLGVTKVYATRVGGGPFPSEIHDDTGAWLRQKGGEFGVNTGRPRRCGWLDIVQLKQACTVAGIGFLALTKLDVLDGLETVRLCVGYEVDGVHCVTLPASLAALKRATPVYEDLPGWSAPTRGIRKASDLPSQARHLIARIATLTEIQVAVVTTGPERDDTIIYQDVFAR